MAWRHVVLSKWKGLSRSGKPFNTGEEWDGYADKLKNWYLSEDGSLWVRRGTLRWNASSLGSGDIQGSIRAYPAQGTTPRFLVGHSGTIYKGNDGPKTFASSSTGWNSTALMWFCQWGRFVYASDDAGTTPKKYDTDADSWVTMGVLAPSAAVSAAGAAGSLTGTYRIKITFVAGTDVDGAIVESNPSPASTDLTVTNKQINLTSIPLGAAGTGVIKRRVYGFKVAVSNDYQLIAEISNNTDTTYTITTDQSVWTTTVPSLNDQPVAGAWIMAIWKNRGWRGGATANPTRLYFTKTNKAEAWPPLQYLDIPFKSGDEITALLPMGDVLLVFGNEQVFYITGESATSFMPRETLATSGAPGPWAVDRIESVAIYLSRNGVMILDGIQERCVSRAISVHFEDLPSDPKLRLNYAGANRACVKFYDKMKAVLVAFPVGVNAPTHNNQVYWFFVQTAGWAEDSRGPEASRGARQFLVMSTYDNDGKLYVWDGSAGILREWDVLESWQDDGSVITAEMEVQDMTGRNPFVDKIWQGLVMKSTTYGTATFTVDVDEGKETDTFTMSPTNEDQRFAPTMRGRLFTLNLSWQVTTAARLSELYVRYLETKALRSKGSLS